MLIQSWNLYTEIFEVEGHTRLQHRISCAVICFKYKQKTPNETNILK